LPRSSSADDWSARWLEEFDRVPGWVVEQGLLAAGAADDVVAEADASRAESLDFGGDVVDDEWIRFQPPGSGFRPSGSFVALIDNVSPR
jgi:hypothetical protein